MIIYLRKCGALSLYYCACQEVYCFIKAKLPLPLKGISSGCCCLFIYLLLSGFSFKERKKKEGLFELYQIGLVYVLFKL